MKISRRFFPSYLRPSCPGTLLLRGFYRRRRFNCLSRDFVAPRGPSSRDLRSRSLIARFCPREYFIRLDGNILRYRWVNWISDKGFGGDTGFARDKG